MDSIKAPSPDQPKPGVLLGDWLDLWYQSYKKPNLRPNTQMSYERRIYQHIIPVLGNIQMDKLTTNDIQQFYSELKKDELEHYAEPCGRMAAKKSLWAYGISWRKNP